MQNLVQRVAQQHLIALNPGAIDKTWIEDIRKSWKRVTKIPPAFRSSGDYLKFMTVVSAWVQRFVDDLAFNKGFWLPMEVWDGGAKDGLFMRKLKAKILGHLSEVDLILKDGADDVRYLTDIITPGTNYHRMDRGHTWKLYLNNAGGDEEAALALVFRDLREKVKEAMDKATAVFSGKLLRHLTSILTQFNSPTLELESYDREYSLGKMKIVFQDAYPLYSLPGHRDLSHPETNPNSYFRYFDTARKMLVKHGLEKLWYGFLYVQCKECGGTNSLGAHFGVGAHYVPSKDHIVIFSDPSPQLVRLLIHELGHRYYYKFMTNTDRAEFDSYFGKVDAVSDYGATVTYEDFAEVFAWYVTGRNLTPDQRGRLEKFFKKVQRRASVMVTAPYLKQMLTTLLKDPEGWGTAGAAYQLLHRRLRSLEQGLADPYPISDLWADLEAADADPDDLALLQKVRPPREPSRKPEPSLYHALQQFEEATGKTTISRSVGLDDDHFAPLVTAYTKAFQSIKNPDVQKVWRLYVKKVVLSSKGYGSEDASWQNPNLVLVLKKGAVPSVATLRYNIIHELGHALASNVPFKHFDLYGTPPYVSDYASKNGDEDFAETFALYVTNPSKLKRLSPQKFEDMASRLG